MFEFDPAKSAANKAKHGIDFVEAQALWRDQNAVGLPTRTEPEARHLLVGTMHGKVWTAVYTMRGQAIRLISVRRARPIEVQYYERNQ